MNVDVKTKSAIWHNIVSSAEHDDCTNPNINSRKNLDNHANMVVLGSNSCVVNYNGKTAQVHAFSPEYEDLQSRSRISLLL